MALQVGPLQKQEIASMMEVRTVSEVETMSNHPKSYLKALVFEPALHYSNHNFYNWLHWE